MATAALLTDRYELTMLQAALADGTASRRSVFEVFARRLPDGRRYGVVAGTGRLLELLPDLRFDDEALGWLAREGVVDERTCEHLAGWRFTGDVDGYPEGEVYVPGSPLLTVRGTFAEAVVLETLVLSVLNHDSAVAAAASRMTSAADGRPCLEMGSRRTHEEAAVAAARAAAVAGFAGTSNLEAGRRYGLPTIGTSAHAFTLLHDDEDAAFAAQVAALGPSTTLLVDTYDVAAAVERAVALAGPGLGAVRLDSGDLGELAHDTRRQLDRLGATGTRITVTSDLDEHAIAALGTAPVDSYGVGTSLVTGSGAPTAGLVYKMVAREDAGGDLRGVAKASRHKEGVAGAKRAWREVSGGVASAEVLVVEGDGGAPEVPGARPVQVALVRGGEVVAEGATGPQGVRRAAARHGEARAELPADARRLQRGEPCLPTHVLGARA
ncbi:nicotinate phosphoribosyltransferase [Pseudokineococcus basanitobsidens]|uniref:Nicotinate phosphoribosyltransferase n=2 Tax=Pseudokineococcus basanitobsidens TaxID=1926649 RepID=A0ABU8RJG5_9ACTN